MQVCTFKSDASFNIKSNSINSSDRSLKNIKIVNKKKLIPCVPLAQKYDYIIAGGGTAGCVLANRLSADSEKNVLLLETGSVVNDITVKVPYGIARLFKSTYDWNLYSSKQSQLENREIYLARGKLVGGSSCTNATLYLRGSPEDYDKWNMEGWESQDVLKWFIKAESNEKGASRFHGASGMMKVENPRYRNKLYDIIFKAAEEMGINSNSDFNDWSRSQEGYGEFQVTQNKGTRADAYVQYLKPIIKRENLTVKSNVTASKIIFERNKEIKKAIGIKYFEGYDKQNVKDAELNINGELILSAGAIHSPQLLILSGIGAENEIREIDGEVVIPLDGVGKNLQDHPAVLSAFFLKKEYEYMAMTNVFNKSGNIKKLVLFNYLFRRRGHLTTTGCDRGAFVCTRNKGGLPDLQLRFPGGYALDPDGVSSYVKFGELLKKNKLWPGGITVQVICCRPESKGTVSVISDQIVTPPKIDINYLSDPNDNDINTLKSGLKLSRELAKSRPLSDYLEKEGFPGIDIQTDRELETYIKNTVHSANALVGTCKMGKSQRDGSVVDHNLIVHGTENLRVIDSSVIPIIPGAQTGAATVMIAEKAAYEILNKKTNTTKELIKAV